MKKNMLELLTQTVSEHDDKFKVKQLDNANFEFTLYGGVYQFQKPLFMTALKLMELPNLQAMMQSFANHHILQKGTPITMEKFGHDTELGFILFYISMKLSGMDLGKQM